MNEHYQCFVEYLERVATGVEKAGELLTGEYVWFFVEMKKGCCMGCTCQSVRQRCIDRLYWCICVLECTSCWKRTSIRFLIWGAVPRYGWKPWCINVRAAKQWITTVGVDWLLKDMPNATRHANEAHRVFQVLFLYYNIMLIWSILQNLKLRKIVLPSF